MRASTEIQGSGRISLRADRTPSLGGLHLGLARRDALDGRLSVWLVVLRNCPVDGDLGRHQERRTAHGPTDDADAPAVEVLGSLLAQAEVGRGIAASKSGIQSRAIPRLGQAVGSEKDQVAVEGERPGDVDLAGGQEFLAPLVDPAESAVSGREAQSSRAPQRRRRRSRCVKREVRVVMGGPSRRSRGSALGEQGIAHVLVGREGGVEGGKIVGVEPRQWPRALRRCGRPCPSGRRHEELFVRGSVLGRVV